MEKTFLHFENFDCWETHRLVWQQPHETPPAPPATQSEQPAAQAEVPDLAKAAQAAAEERKAEAARLARAEADDRKKEGNPDQRLAGQLGLPPTPSPETGSAAPETPAAPTETPPQAPAEGAQAPDGAAPGVAPDAPAQTEIQPPTEDKLKQAFNKIFNDAALKTAYEQFIKDGKKDDFLAKISDGEDKTTIIQTIDAQVRQDEIERAKREFANGMPKNETELQQFAMDRHLDYHEIQVLRAIVSENTETRQSITRAVEAGGIGALLTTFVEKITELADKIGKWLEKMFKSVTESQQPKFLTSPVELSSGEKPTISQYKEGAGVELKCGGAGKNVVCVGGGKVTEVTADSMTLAIGNPPTKIIYSGIAPDTTLKDKEVKMGDKLGKTTGDTLKFRLVDENSKDVDPTAYLRDYTQTAQAAAPAKPEAQTEAPVLKIKNPPIELAANKKLSIKKDFTNNDEKGIEINAGKDGNVKMMSDGRIVEAKDGKVTIEHKDGKKIIISGLKIENPPAAGDKKANELIGQVDEKGLLTIQILENNRQVDPENYLGDYIS